MYVRRFTSVCCSSRHFRHGELFTVSSLTIDTAAPVSISIVSVCPSTSIVVCSGLLLQPSTGNSEYSVLAGSSDSWLTPLLLALGSGFVSECLPGTDLQTLAMWPCFLHEQHSSDVKWHLVAKCQPPQRKQLGLLVLSFP